MLLYRARFVPQTSVTHRSEKIILCKVFHWHLSLVMIQLLYPCRYVVVVIVSCRGQKKNCHFLSLFQACFLSNKLLFSSRNRSLRWANEYCFQGMKVDAAFSFSPRQVNSSLLRPVYRNTEYDRSHWQEKEIYKKSNINWVKCTNLQYIRPNTNNITKRERKMT